METHGFFRLGAASAVFGTGLALVAQLFHPEALRNFGDESANVRSKLEMIGQSDTWVLAHGLVMVSFILFFFGSIAIARSMRVGRSEGWARVSSAATAATLALGVLFPSVEIAQKSVVDRWLGAAPLEKASALFTGQAIEYLHRSVFKGFVLLLALTLLLFGITMILSNVYSNALAWAALITGAISSIGALIQIFSGYSQLTLAQYTIELVSVRVIFAWAGIELWRKQVLPATVVRP